MKKPSVIWLYIGMFMCCTGIGTIGGIIMIILWFYGDFNSKIDSRRQQDFYAYGGTATRNLA